MGRSNIQALGSVEGVVGETAGELLFVVLVVLVEFPVVVFTVIELQLPADSM